MNTDKLKFTIGKRKKPDPITLKDCEANDLVLLGDGSIGLVVSCEEDVIKEKMQSKSLTLVSLTDNTNTSTNAAIVSNDIENAISGRGEYHIVKIIGKFEIEGLD